MTITTQKEKFAHFMQEAETLFAKHYEEVAERTDVIKLDPDWDQYLTLEKANMLELHTLRDDKKIIGYSIWFLLYHIHCKQSFTAMSDVLYIDPQYRKGMTGIKFLKWTTEEIKKRNPQRITFHVKPHVDYGRILERLGAHFFEKTYTIVLE